MQWALKYWPSARALVTDQIAVSAVRTEAVMEEIPVTDRTCTGLPRHHHGRLDRPWTRCPTVALH